MDEVGVEARLRPHICRARTRCSFHFYDTTVGPEEQDAVHNGGGSGDDGACNGGSVPFIAPRGEEVVCDCEDAECGGSEGGSTSSRVSGRLDVRHTLGNRTGRLPRPGTSHCDRQSIAAQ